MHSQHSTCFTARFKILLHLSLLTVGSVNSLTRLVHYTQNKRNVDFGFLREGKLDEKAICDSADHRLHGAR